MPPASATGITDRIDRGDLRAVKIYRAVVADRPQHRQVFMQPLHRVGGRNAEDQLFDERRSEAEPKAEVAMGGGLGGLRRRGHDQRMARVDRNHRRSHHDAGNGRADDRGQRDRVIVDLLAQPQLSHTGFVGAARLFDSIVDYVGRRAVRRNHHPGNHVVAPFSRACRYCPRASSPWAVTSTTGGLHGGPRATPVLSTGLSARARGVQRDTPGKPQPHK